jgi:hypothetical protein
MGLVKAASLSPDPVTLKVPGKHRYAQLEISLKEMAP